ncbi:hypothetical protein Pfo_024033 [Paulownia fortunei]|nr:hypothetical protein Pfo_024033 [Paulownia fortunei]
MPPKPKPKPNPKPKSPGFDLQRESKGFLLQEHDELKLKGRGRKDCCIKIISIKPSFSYFLSYTFWTVVC